MHLQNRNLIAVRMYEDGFWMDKKCCNSRSKQFNKPINIPIVLIQT